MFSRKFKYLKFQITLIKSGWNELMIIGAAYRSLSLNEEGILMGQGKVITMEDAHRAGLGEIFDRVLVELVGKMEEMKMVSLLTTFTQKKIPAKNGVGKKLSMIFTDFLHMFTFLNLKFDQRKIFKAHFRTKKFQKLSILGKKSLLPKKFFL